MTASQKHKLLISTGIILTFSIVCYTTIYLPFYSNEALKRKLPVNNNKDNKNNIQVSNSMWKNMDQYIKEREK